MWIVSLILFIFILGIIILVHEFGHFIWAKKCGVFIYEFSIGMGPVLISHKGKDGIFYNIRAFPIGGFVQMAGEIYEDDSKIPKKKFLCNRPWYQRLIILVAGVMNNFLLALVLLFVMALIWGPTSSYPKVYSVQEGSRAMEAGMQAGDVITAINGHHFTSWDVGQLYLYFKDTDHIYDFEVNRNGEMKELHIEPKTEVDEDGKERDVFGIQISTEAPKGILESLGFMFRKFYDVICSMAVTIGGIFTGQISLDSLSGPVGIYQVVDQSVQYGIRQLIYITAFLSINVGFINILPFPAFDGGHVLFMLIEKIKGSKVNAKIENIVTMIGFGLILLLMVYITIQDLIRLF